MRWSDVEPDPRMSRALDVAGPRPEDGSQTDKKKWSSRFADQCAIMLADSIRAHRWLRGPVREGKVIVYPTEEGTKVESLTGLRGGKQKRVDVAASSPSAGLQFALSLKGGNFIDPDPAAGYGKNITGRLYEFQDEARVIHEYHPHSLLVCLYFFPVDACTDKKRTSTLAKVVQNLRSMTGRSDPLMQFSRADWSAVGLYSPEPNGAGLRPGVVRFFDVNEDPPEKGRPRIEHTMSLVELVDRTIHLYRDGDQEPMKYGEPEPEG